MTSSPLLVDFETYCYLDVTEVGAYQYVSHSTFVPLLMSYGRHDGTEVHVAQGPAEIRNVVRGLRHFAGWGQFDRIVLMRILGHDDFIYEDVMVRAAEVGYPLKLEHAAKAAGLKVQKNPRGRTLIPRFCKPMKDGTRRTAEDDPERWAEFVFYCRDDTIVMRELYNRTPPLTAREQELYELDMIINQRGVQVDLDAVQKLRELALRAETRLDEIVSEATGDQIRSISQVEKLMMWFHSRGCTMENLQADYLEGVLQTRKLPADVRRVLQCRLAGAKASTKKLIKFLACTDRQGRIRGLLQFCGAHTRRWAGRLVQPQNFPRDSFTPEDFDSLLKLIHHALGWIVENTGLSPLEAISKALRGLLIPTPGHKFLVVDYAAIEARILAWFANQLDVLAIYLEGGDVYKDMASTIFGIPANEIDGGQRFLGKTIVLGCGYMLCAVKLMESTLAKAGIVVDLDTAKNYIAAFRTRYNRVVALWENLREGMKLAVRDGKRIRIGKDNRTTWIYVRGGAMVIELPNKQKLFYHGARLDEVVAPWDKNPVPARRQKILAVTAMMKDEKGWARRPLSPGLITENIIQALAREVMGAGMLRAERAGFPIVLTVHDEVVAEVPDAMATPENLKRFEQLLCELEPWAEGLPLKAEGKIMSRYGK